MRSGHRTWTGRISNKAKRYAWNLLSYGIAAACLYWVFHDISLSALLQSMVGVRWSWLVPAVVLVLLVYVCAGWEWHLLLRPSGNLSVRRTTQAIFAGRFANDVLPVHAGYVIRVYLASRWMGSGVAAIIPSLVIERLFDGLWLAVGIGFLTMFFPMPAELAHAGKFLGGVILGGAVVVGWMTLRKRNEHLRKPGASLRWKPLHEVLCFIRELEQGVRRIGRSYIILGALGLSILKLILLAAAFLSVLNAYNFTLSFWAKLAVFMLTYVGISVPSTPASLGVFQLFCAAGLKFFGASKPAAGGFALLAYVVLTAPLAIAGLVAISRSGLTLRQVREEIRQWRS
jgi:uncharacterized membrane protein YbhN (UPF0104 family)